MISVKEEEKRYNNRNLPDNNCPVPGPGPGVRPSAVCVMYTAVTAARPAPAPAPTYVDYGLFTFITVMTVHRTRIRDLDIYYQVSKICHFIYHINFSENGQNF